jgi:hypothetical protein
MPDVELLATDEGEYRIHDPDAFRSWTVMSLICAQAPARPDRLGRPRRRGDRVDPTMLGADRRRPKQRTPGPGGVTGTALEILREPIDPGRTVIGRTAKS